MSKTAKEAFEDAARRWEEGDQFDGTTSTGAKPNGHAGPQSGLDAETEAELDRLAKMSAFEYAKARKAAAKKLGVRGSDLDEDCKERRAKLPGNGKDSRQGQPLEFPEIKPWALAVNGTELLDEMAEHLQRFAIMPTAHATTATILFGLHCHAFDAAVYTPRLLITSPTRECGKSQVMIWLAGVVPKPLEVIDPTGPTLFRPIEAHQPTVLIDEGDLVSWDERRDVRMVINAGHCRFSPGVPRCIGEDFETRVFRVWAPFAYAMIGTPLYTLLSRSIRVGMVRMAPEQQPEHRRIDQDQGFTAIRRKCARWAADHLDALRNAEPNVPVCWSQGRLLATALSYR
jgi:hypothetical protein